MGIADIGNAYLVGIKGTGLSALAQILRAHGAHVSGSDVSEYFFTQKILDANDVRYYESFNSAHITSDIDVVIYSTAYDCAKNPELIEAAKQGKMMISYPEFLGRLAQEKLSIAVCGSHGKTTTTALLAHVLKGVGENPSAIVGSRVRGWNGSALSGRGKHFIFEADEYQNKFQFYTPWSAILTNIDWDHPDFFPTEEAYRETFVSFLKKVMSHGHVVVCGDDADAVSAAKASGRQFVTYGFSDSTSEFICDAQSTLKDVQKFKIKRGADVLGEFEIQLAGKHNVLNATSVVAMCTLLKLDMEKVAEGLKTFQGTARRFEKVGEYNKAILIDDYAHHPREIQAVLQAACARYPRKNIVAVFQPHTFTRTKALFEDFAQCFTLADRVLILDIYASAREATGDVTSKHLVEKINAYEYRKAEYTGTIDTVTEVLRKSVGENDVALTMGAGDVWRVNERLKEES